MSLKKLSVICVIAVLLLSPLLLSQVKAAADTYTFSHEDFTSDNEYGVNQALNINISQPFSIMVNYTDMYNPTTLNSEGLNYGECTLDFAIAGLDDFAYLQFRYVAVNQTDINNVNFNQTDVNGFGFSALDVDPLDGNSNNTYTLYNVLSIVGNGTDLNYFFGDVFVGSEPVNTIVEYESDTISSLRVSYPVSFQSVAQTPSQGMIDVTISVPSPSPSPTPTATPYGSNFAPGFVTHHTPTPTVMPTLSQSSSAISPTIIISAILAALGAVSVLVWLKKK